MSKNRQYLESKGWRLFSRRKHGMYIVERWYHPNNGSVTFTQEQAVREQRMIDRAQKAKAPANRGHAALAVRDHPIPAVLSMPFDTTATKRHKFQDREQGKEDLRVSRMCSLD